jgi:hypothetical protein
MNEEGSLNIFEDIQSRIRMSGLNEDMLSLIFNNFEDNLQDLRDPEPHDTMHSEEENYGEEYYGRDENQSPGMTYDPVFDFTDPMMNDNYDPNSNIENNQVEDVYLEDIGNENEGNLYEVYEEEVPDEEELHAINELHDEVHGIQDHRNTQIFELIPESDHIEPERPFNRIETEQNREESKQIKSIPKIKLDSRGIFPTALRKINIGMFKAPSNSKKKAKPERNTELLKNITELRKQNTLLRQTNKNLEDKLTSLEKTKSQAQDHYTKSISELKDKIESIETEMSYTKGYNLIDLPANKLSELESSLLKTLQQIQKEKEEVIHIK